MIKTRCWASISLVLSLAAATAVTVQVIPLRPLAPPTAIAAESPPPQRIRIRVEGEAVDIELARYAPSGIPFTTYYPKPDFAPILTRLSDGIDVRFIATFGGQREESAYVRLFFPHRNATVAGMRRWLGKQNKGWRALNRTRITGFPWAIERIDFEEKQPGQPVALGSAFIGKRGDRAFAVIERFPADYGDGFAPRASIILKYLR